MDKIKKLSEHAEFLALKRILNLFENSSFEENDPLPFAAVIITENGKYILDEKNGYTNLMNDDDKFQQHAETILMDEINGKDLGDVPLRIFTSIPPCKKCYEAIISEKRINEIIYISNYGLPDKELKWNEITNRLNRRIKYRQIDMDNQKVKDELSKGFGKKYFHLINSWSEGTIEKINNEKIKN